MTHRDRNEKEHYEAAKRLGFRPATVTKRGRYGVPHWTVDTAQGEIMEAFATLEEAQACLKRVK